MPPENDEVQVDDIGADIKAAMEEVAEPEIKEAEPAPADAQEEPEAPAEPEKDETPPPATWSAAAKEEWKNATPVLKQEILKRETDFHKMVTHHEGDLNLGRTFKEVVAPYMANIQAEGLTPTAAVAGILKNDHFLRTAPAAARTAKFYELASYYGVDISNPPEQTYEDPTITELKQQIEQLKQTANPEHIKNQLQQEQEDASFKQELVAFASDPANAYFDQVRPLVATLIGSGQAKDLKEAYDMACNARPDIRSALLQKQKAEEAAKRKIEIEAKRKAGSSVSGSSGIAAPSTAKSTNSIEDDIREAMRSMSSSI